jgi:hypothetical protein
MPFSENIPPRKKSKAPKNTRKHLKRSARPRKGGKSFKKHVKAVVRTSRINPEKPVYKVYVFDDIRGNTVDALKNYARDTIEETEEELITMRENWKGQPKEPEKVVVYGFTIQPKLRV